MVLSDDWGCHSCWPALAELLLPSLRAMGLHTREQNQHDPHGPHTPLTSARSTGPSDVLREHRALRIPSIGGSTTISQSNGWPSPPKLTPAFQDMWCRALIKAGKS